MSQNLDDEIAIDVLFFSGAAETVGLKRLHLTIRAGDTLGDLSTRLEDCYPGLRRLEHSGRWAINEEFCEFSRVLEHRCTSEFLPPVSGG